MLLTLRVHHISRIGLISKIGLMGFLFFMVLASLLGNVSCAGRSRTQDRRFPRRCQPGQFQKNFAEVNLLGKRPSASTGGAYKEDKWPQGWEVKDGVLARTEAGGDIMTKATYKDFRFTLEWKISKNGNSGIMYRVRSGDDAPYLSGPEYQVLDNVGHPNGKDKLTSAAALYGLYAPEKDWTKPVGEWNKAKIVVRGNRVRHWLNGHKTVDCEMGSDDWNKRISQSKFKDWKQFAKSAEGHIVLQDHGDLVWYRNISVKPLQAKAGSHKKTE